MSLRVHDSERGNLIFRLSFLYVKKASPNFNIMRITYVLFQIIRCEAIFKINLLLADRP